MMNQKSNEQLQCIAISCLQAVSLLVPSVALSWCVALSLVVALLRGAVVERLLL
jgi:hypothetical protein